MLSVPTITHHNYNSILAASITSKKEKEKSQLQDSYLTTMGCSSSKRIEAAVDVYRPAPTSFAVFDINAIDEPWVKVVVDDTSQLEQEKEKPTHVPAPILEKLSTFESDTPHSWDEVSKALEDLKPALHAAAIDTVPKSVKPDPVVAPQPEKDASKQPPQKSSSFRTVAELDAKLSKTPESKINGLKKTESLPAVQARFNSLKENIFLVRDREERQKEGKPVKYDPLCDFPEMCPPGGADSLVLYTTSLRGVRRTFEDCDRVKSVLEGRCVVFDERDVALHGEFLNELKALLGEEASVPRMFLKGRYIGGAEEVVALNETGKLVRILRRAGVETGVGRQGCEGCGGARFVPCMECGGSCKVINGETKEKERCGECNENGLALCPVCH